MLKITKYPQSHLVITNEKGNKLIIDPGYITFDPAAGSGQIFRVEEFQGADAYLITHQHNDHLGPETIKGVVGQGLVFGNFDVAIKLKEIGVVAKEVSHREKFSVAGFEIEAINLPHFKKLGVIMPSNTGFLINGVFFHSGDGWKLEGIVSRNAAVPIAGPQDGDIGFNQALTLAKNLQAKVIIPIHYDKFSADPAEFAKLAASFGIEVRPLAWGEQTCI